MLLTEHGFTQIPIEGGELSFAGEFYAPATANAYLTYFLSDAVEWRQEEILIYGKRHPQPRLVAWYGDEGRTYTYSRLRLTPNPWNSTLLDIKRDVEKAAATTFNSVLLNLYRTGLDSIAWHADDEPELGDQPTIASLSLGATRRFRFRHRVSKAIRELPLTHGSLLVMRGAVQRHWVHDIPKEKSVQLPRVNLTFRKVG